MEGIHALMAEFYSANLASEIKKGLNQKASRCGKAHRQASDRGRRNLNKAVFESLEVRDGKIADVKFHAPFDLLFSREKFEYERFVGPGSLHANHFPLVAGQTFAVGNDR